ncbi:MAG: transcriptional repressor [Firmicutes bacterium]|nr:transcriptional repressor [Bacillota bacterium]
MRKDAQGGTPDEPGLESHQPVEQRLRNLLEQAGHRVTEPRMQLIRAVAAQDFRPFTGEALYEGLRDTGLGRATVFRTLRLLQNLGALSRLHLDDGCQRYVLTLPGASENGHHDRLICRQCGRVAYLEQCPMEDSLNRIAEQSGYRVESHHLDILGLCGDCLAAGNDQ